MKVTTIYVGVFIVLCANMASYQPAQSWHIEPAKSDISAAKFEIFCDQWFDKQLDDRMKKYGKDWVYDQRKVWNPQFVDQGKSNSIYMQLDLVLLAVQCLHHFYIDDVNFNVYDVVRRLLTLNCCKNNTIQHKVKKQIQVRVVKQFKFNNGASNSFVVGKGDIGWLKPVWIDKNSGTKSHYNMYGSLFGVEFVFNMIVMKSYL